MISKKKSVCVVKEKKFRMQQPYNRKQSNLKGFVLYLANQYFNFSKFLPLKTILLCYTAFVILRHIPELKNSRKHFFTKDQNPERNSRMDLLERTILEWSL